jgi:hypothetical protein
MRKEKKEKENWKIKKYHRRNEVHFWKALWDIYLR